MGAAKAAKGYLKDVIAVPFRSPPVERQIELADGLERRRIFMVVGPFAYRGTGAFCRSVDPFPRLPSWYFQRLFPRPKKAKRDI
jgi:hypothetical protein